ncbi:hypothetical protein FACS1894139_13260 [Planctomycetales bacterium]|nr:hypothetical protein FACS1894107_09710 [Planctomycetales bacterium]GHT06731.1 hypothetical protein FACS1894139_13260 [Planctomycetales bacterium]GHV20590.1 hypothetical protein AGMMS49959_08260 [Planctomycetales bacterium]
MDVTIPATSETVAVPAWRVSLGTKLMITVVFMALTVGGVAVGVGYYLQKIATEERYEEIGRQTAISAASLLDGDKVAAYRHLPPDDDYREIEREFALLKEANSYINYLYVYLPDVENHRDLSLFSDGDGDGEPVYDDWASYDENREFYDDYARGVAGEPLIEYSPTYGYTFSIYEPLYAADKKFVGYVGVDFDMNDVIAEEHRFLILLSLIVCALTLLFSLLYVYIIRRLVVTPVEMMTAATRNWTDYFLSPSATVEEKTHSVAIDQMQVLTNDELETLCHAIKAMEKKLNFTITELKLDSFTKLYNRATFDAMLSQCFRHFLATQAMFCLLVIDIDKFKSVNDTYGHSFGDQVILTLVKTLKAGVRASDYCFRYGGEEFAVILNTAPTIAFNIADKLRENFHQQVLPEHPSLRFSISIGICEVGTNYESARQIFLNADQALYQAKESGRNRVVRYEGEGKS